MYSTSSYLSPFSSPFLTAPPSVYRSINELHRRRNSPIPIPIYSADDIESETIINSNNTSPYTSSNTNTHTHYRIPITDLSSTKENETRKVADVSVVHEKPTVRRSNLKLSSPTNPFEEAEQRKSSFGIIDRVWEREIAKRKATEFERLEQEELNRALRESMEIEGERQRIEHDKREQDELEMALRISEEEARQAEIYKEIERSLRLKNELSMKKGKAKVVDEDEEKFICDNVCEDEQPCDPPAVLTRLGSPSKSKSKLNLEPSLPYPNTTLITINMWGRQRFMKRFYVDETISSIRNWVETFNTPQNYTMKITSPTYLAGVKLSDLDMTKLIQDINLYPHGEIWIEPY